MDQCRDLRALTHLDNLTEFTHFGRHNFSAPGHFYHFCRPVQSDQDSGPGLTENPVEVIKSLEVGLGPLAANKTLVQDQGSLDARVEDPS